MGTQPAPRERWLTTKESMALLGIRSRDTFHRYRQMNDFPKPTQLGAGPTSPLRFRESELERWRESRCVT